MLLEVSVRNFIRIVPSVEGAHVAVVAPFAAGNGRHGSFSSWLQGLGHSCPLPPAPRPCAEHQGNARFELCTDFKKLMFF